MRHFLSLLVLCYVIALASSQYPYHKVSRRTLVNGGGGGVQQPNYNYGGGQQPNYNYEGGQQPNYNYGGGQQPNYNYGGGQQPNYNYGGGQQPNYDYGGGQQPNYNYGEMPPQRISCDPPMCAPGCSLQTVYDGPCPGCECPNKGGQQPNYNYGGGQQQTYNYGGDPTPQISCDPPMCAPGCSLQTVYDGPCPGCQCPKGGGQQSNYNYGGGQQQAYNYGGDPTPQISCDPPMCAPGCSLQTVYDGPCPGCECPKGGQQPNYNYGGGQQPNYNYGGGQQQTYNYGGIQPAQGNYGGCQQPDCAPFCTVSTGPDGCPECICIQN